MSDLANIIKSLRQSKDVSMEEMANELKTYGANPSKSMISRWENGKADPSMNYLRILSKYFNVSLDYLLGFNDDELSNLKESVEVYESINRDMSNIVNIPIVGSVRAGQPILATQNIDGYLPTLKNFLNSNNDYFYLKIQGDSMNLEFKEGSFILVEKTPCVENGEIGIVLIDGMEATVKKVIQNDNMITLLPMSTNPEHVPKMYDIVKDEIQIIGRVRQAIKQY